ncbi:MAG: ABC transporter permease [Beutenbergiaceae bacterium]
MTGDPAQQDAPAAAEPSTGEPSGSARVQQAVQAMFSSSWVITVGAVLLALVIGSILILIGDQDVQETTGYFFSRPSDFFVEAWRAISQSYLALFQGAIYDNQASSASRAIRPLTETLTISAPLILAGLGIGLGFRAGLFNIGGQSQMVLGAVFGTYLGFAYHLPVFVHITVVMVGTALGGALAGAMPGFLKARFGAHEVITTIMLNNVSTYFLLWLLTTSVFASSTPQVSKPLDETARLGLMLGSDFRLHIGFLLALVAALAVWLLMERSVLGFHMRSVGSNADAARTAGMSVGRVTIAAMAISGALCGLAGGMQVAGTEGQLTTSVAGSIGFDAITVALLGRSRPMGTVLAGLLFGALAAGGRLMAARAGTEAELVMVLQSLIVLLIAAPPLVRAVFRLPEPRIRAKEVAA